MKKIKVVIFVLISILVINGISLAHPGRTDSNGGHYNRSTGEYHYHNGGTSTGLNINDGLIVTDNSDNLAETIQENNELKDKVNLLEGKISIYEEELKKAGYNSITDMKYKIEDKESEIDGLWTMFVIIFVIGIIIAYNIGKNRK